MYYNYFLTPFGLKLEPEEKEPRQRPQEEPQSDALLNRLAALTREKDNLSSTLAAITARLGELEKSAEALKKTLRDRGVT